MAKRVHPQKADRRKSINPETISRADLPDPRDRYITSYYLNSKRNIEKFFRLQSFPEKATKKAPKERTKSGMKLCHLMALFDKRCRQVDDQKREHRRTLRKSSNRRG
jgi:hypothetical protein